MDDNQPGFQEGTLATPPESWTPATKRRRIDCCPTSAHKRQRCSRPPKHVNVLDDCDALQLHCRNHNDQHCDKCVFAKYRVT